MYLFDKLIKFICYFVNAKEFIENLLLKDFFH